MQRKLRHLAPMPVGCVFLPWPGMTEDEAREQFRTMRRLGFTCLKQTMPTPEWPEERTLNLALDEGILPFWYAEGGYEDITPELLARLGLPGDMDVDAAMEHPAVIAHQHALLRARITSQGQRRAPQPAEAPAPAQKDWVPGMVGTGRGHELNPEVIPHFVAWLRERHDTLDGLREAWHCRHVGIADRRMSGWQRWEDVEVALRDNFRLKEYQHILDMLRFRADVSLERLRQRVARQQEADPHEPLRAGGEMGLFLPFASRGTDMEGIALEMADGGSFYPSIHLTWHFDEVNFEVARPVYMQASIAADWAKGIWSATWESTGGPNYFSGGKGALEETKNVTPGNSCTAGTMTQMMLSYLAAGFRGFGLWTWNYRTAGWEAGEYAIVDRNLKAGPRAERIGLIGRTARTYRRELWAAQKEPMVGVLVDWQQEAIWGAMGVLGRDKYKYDPVRARVGVSRALIDANVPWEYVTTHQLAQGLGPRYQVVYAPAFIAFSEELQGLLEAFVRQGGRLVIDMPAAHYDGEGVMLRTDAGTWFERVFGAELNELAYSRETEETWSVEGVEIDGFTCIATPTRARVVAPFSNGLPAVLEGTCGEGQGVLCCWQGSLGCFRPGHEALQELVVRHTLGGRALPYTCEGALAYRLAAPKADHWFLVNPDGPKTVVLQPHAYRYGVVIDAMTGEALDLSLPIALEGYSGRWLRAERRASEPRNAPEGRLG
jgi:beta-galactosidase